MQHVLGEICILIAGLTGASRVTVNRLNKKEKSVEIMGSSTPIPSGTQLLSALLFLSADQPLQLFKNLRSDTRFKANNFLKEFPQAKSLIAYVLCDHFDHRYSVTIWNPKASCFSDDQMQGVIERFAEIIKQILLNDKKEKGAPNQVSEGFAEMGSAFSSQPVSSFLVRTLIQRQRLLARNGASYLALRQWRKELKPYQIEALQALKKNPGDAFEDVVAAEIHAAVAKVYGKLFDMVVPIPGGSSGSENSFSVRIAEKTARLLKIPLVMALSAAPVAKGKSHPAKSAVLQPYRLATPVSGSVLIIDDVASSGRHLELGHAALSEIAKYCTSVVWIAD